MNIEYNIKKIIYSSANKDDVKVIGHEQDGRFIIRRICNRAGSEHTCVSIFHEKKNRFQTLYQVNVILDIIQASVDFDNSVLVFVTKNATSIDKMTNKWEYSVYCITLSNKRQIHLPNPSSAEMQMAQFLYKKKQTDTDRFLLFTHHRSIILYQVTKPTITNNKTKMEINISETIAKSFSWCQWNSEFQTLFYIHHRENSSQDIANGSNVPTLTAFQFHDDMPHETVLNIPLVVGTVDKELATSHDKVYTDIPIPLRIQDCCTNLLVLMQSSGKIYICYHYCSETQESRSNCLINDQCNCHLTGSAQVYFSYTVIAVHHASYINCTTDKKITADQAIKLHPIFVLYSEEHVLVSGNGMFTHLLDIGSLHESTCHILLPCIFNSDNDNALYTIPNRMLGVINLETLDVIQLSISKQVLISTFNCHNVDLSDKLAILHYFIVHLNDMDTVTNLLLGFGENVFDLNLSSILKEFLIAGTYFAMTRSLPPDAMGLLKLLPLTTVKDDHKLYQVNEHLNVIFRNERLNNMWMMVLTPRQRLIPFRADVWTRLWDYLPTNNEPHSRFHFKTVCEKLMISLVCYQPEALSRCCTPLSPGVSHISSTTIFSDTSNTSRIRRIDALPFVEIETSAASTQEHVVSINLREISLHLLKHGRSPMQVHVVSMRYVSSQLEMSRLLCSLLTRSAGINTKHNNRGFSLINELDNAERRLLFALMERYYLSVGALCYPLPLGFPSFFAYLAYKVLHVNKFMSYVTCGAVQLNIDVIKTIMLELSENVEGLETKLNLLLQLPRSRVKRILNQWEHPVSLMIRSREHSSNILSGTTSSNSRLPLNSRKLHKPRNEELKIFSSDDKVSPLDTFLDLLTAKANLTEIDFNLLIEATMSSTAMKNN